jgi:hypothetical protein
LVCSAEHAYFSGVDGTIMVPSPVFFEGRTHS